MNPNPLLVTYTLGQRTSEFVGALQSLSVHSKDHEQIAHRVLNRLHQPRYLHQLTAEQLATQFRTELAAAGVDADCVEAFTACAQQLNLFRDVETLEDMATPWTEQLAP